VAVINTVGSRYVDGSKRKGLHLQQIADEVIALGGRARCPQSRRVSEGKRTKDTRWIDLRRSPPLYSAATATSAMNSDNHFFRRFRFSR
jgi:hypothetical protein